MKKNIVNLFHIYFCSTSFDHRCPAQLEKITKKSWNLFLCLNSTGPLVAAARAPWLRSGAAGAQQWRLVWT
jgi:hypothetical protein